MLIGIDASRANRLERTGVETYAYQMIQELKKQMPGEIQVVLYSDSPLRGELADLPPNWRSQVLRWPPRRLWTQIRLSAAMARRSPDVLFVPAHVFPWWHPKKTVMMIHDIAAVKFPTSYNWFERWYSAWTAWRALKKLWRVIVPSEFVRQEIIRTFEHLDIKDKIFVVRHGVGEDYQKIYVEAAVARVLKKYSLTKPYLVSVGRLEEKKNTVRLIEAFDLIKNFPVAECQSVKLLLAGKPGFGFEKVKAQIDQSHFKKDLITPGWVSVADLPVLLSGAAVFVFPSLAEGFGLPVIEAMAAGVPVVAAQGSALEEVGGGAAIYIDPAKPAEIAATVRELLVNEELKQGQIEKGRARASEFSWQKSAAETLRVLLGE